MEQEVASRSNSNSNLTPTSLLAYRQFVETCTSPATRTLYVKALHYFMRFQREIAQVLHVSPTTITFDLQYLRKETREHIRQYTTEQLPIQFRTFMVATQNAIKQYWNISQEADDNKEKIQALEHYLDCHITLWAMFYGGKALEDCIIVGDGFGKGNSLDTFKEEIARLNKEGKS